MYMHNSIIVFTKVLVNYIVEWCKIMNYEKTVKIFKDLKKQCTRKWLVAYSRKKPSQNQQQQQQQLKLFNFLLIFTTYLKFSPNPHPVSVYMRESM